MITALVFVFMFGPWIIDHLRLRQGKGQPIRTDGPKSHLLTKKGGFVVIDLEDVERTRQGRVAIDVVEATAGLFAGKRGKVAQGLEDGIRGTILGDPGGLDDVAHGFSCEVIDIRTTIVAGQRNPSDRAPRTPFDCGAGGVFGWPRRARDPRIQPSCGDRGASVDTERRRSRSPRASSHDAEPGSTTPVGGSTIRTSFVASRT